MRGFIFVFFSVVLLGVTQLGGATYVWNGAGVDGGNEGADNHLFSNLANWLVDGDVPTVAPGITDDIIVNLDANASGGIALNIDGLHNSEGPPITDFQVGSISFTGVLQTTRRVEVSASRASFTTIALNGTSDSNNYFTLLTGSVLEIRAGSAGTPSLAYGSTSQFGGRGISGPGTLEFTAEETFVFAQGRFWNGTVNFTNSSPDAVVDWTNHENPASSGTHYWGMDSIQFHSNQTHVGLNVVEIGRGTSVVVSLSDSGGPLRMDDTHFRFNLVQGASLQLPEAVIRSARTATSSGTNRQTITQNGDLTMTGAGAGEISLEAIDSGATTGSLRWATWFSRGYDLSVETGNIRLGNWVTMPVGHGSSSHGVLDLRSPDLGDRSTTLHLQGDIEIAWNGSLQGDSGTRIIVEGNWLNYAVFNDPSADSLQRYGFTLESSTVQILGGDVAEAREFQIRGNETADPADGMTLNFGIGRLEIGSESESAYVRLINEDPFEVHSAPQAQYLSQLEVFAGSVLDLNFLPLYVDGVLVEPGSGVYGDGLIVIPEPALAAALTALLLPTIFLRRRILISSSFTPTATLATANPTAREE